MPATGGAFTRLTAPVRAIVARHSTRYWVTAAIVCVVSLWISPFIDARLDLSRERNWLFETLSRTATNPMQARNVKLVLIGDDEYWDGDLHHRIPTDRSYLARLVRALDAADASVIALDFDLRLPDPGPAVVPGDYRAVDEYKPYRDETDDLIRAIDDVAQRRKIVLTKTLAGPVDGPFTLVDDAYQPYGLCVRLTGDGRWSNPGTAEFPLSPQARANITCGYIALMTDKRRVPPPAVITHQTPRLDAFSIAIIRARNAAAVPDLRHGAYYASFISSDLASDRRTTVSAHDLLANPAAVRPILQGWPVIVGAAWNVRARGSGGLVDLHDTPIGPVSGALIHENLAEAVAGGRYFWGLGPGARLGLEVIFAVISALVFAAFHRLSTKFVAILIVAAIAFALQWALLRLFGLFFDAFIPVFGLALHSVIERLVGEEPARALGPALKS